MFRPKTPGISRGNQDVGITKPRSQGIGIAVKATALASAGKNSAGQRSVPAALTEQQLRHPLQWLQRWNKCPFDFPITEAVKRNGSNEIDPQSNIDGIRYCHLGGRLGIGRRLDCISPRASTRPTVIAYTCRGGSAGAFQLLDTFHRNSRGATRTAISLLPKHIVFDE